MDIVETVAAEIADIPGDPSSLEIARVAIEAYQKALWPPLFQDKDWHLRLDLRRNRAQHLTAHMLNIVSKYVCEHGDRDAMQDLSRELMEAFYESGADIVTDADRAAAGLRPRDGYGVTKEELHIMEARRTEAMLRPMQVILPQPAAD